MKALLLLTSAMCIYSFGISQNVGIGLATPLARLHVSDSSVVFSATGTASGLPGNPPISNAGRRMMWYADKGAFRAGFVNGTQWNKPQVGNYSTAMGYDAIASNFASFATGVNTQASGLYSLATGYFSVASGARSTAMGSQTLAFGDYSTALGISTKALGFISTAIGNNATASGINSIAMGDFTKASGTGSTAFGEYSEAGGIYSTSMGNYTKAKGYSSTVIGMFNDSILLVNETTVSPTTPLFIIGNGDNNGTRSNALTVFKNGNVGVGTSAPAASAALDVTSTTKGFLPPRLTSAERDAIVTPIAGLMIWCSNCGPNGQIQIHDGFGWTRLQTTLSIGDSYGGGVVAYVLQSSDPGYVVGETHGLIAAVSDLSTGAVWGCEGTFLSGILTDLGKGPMNTDTIIDQCATAGIAALVCSELVLNGYNDWFLPSVQELVKLHTNRVVIGGFTSNNYWSSSQVDPDNAFIRHFGNGNQVSTTKNSSCYVRAVRAF